MSKNSKAFVLHNQPVFFRNVGVAWSQHNYGWTRSELWCHGNECMQHTWFWACIHSNKMVFCNEPSNEMHRKCLSAVGEAMIKLMYHCTAHYKMELILHICNVGPSLFIESTDSMVLCWILEEVRFLEVNIQHFICVRILFPFTAYRRDNLCQKFRDYFQSFGKGGRIIRRAEFLEVKYGSCDS